MFMFIIIIIIIIIKIKCEGLSLLWCITGRNRFQQNLSDNYKSGNSFSHEEDISKCIRKQLF
jgi:NADH:ubiquinone oxidoreductase subunit 3 (subunit A)